MYSITTTIQDKYRSETRVDTSKMAEEVAQNGAWKDSSQVKDKLADPEDTCELSNGTSHSNTMSKNGHEQPLSREETLNDNTDPVEEEQKEVNGAGSPEKKTVDQGARSIENGAKDGAEDDAKACIFEDVYQESVRQTREYMEAILFAKRNGGKSHGAILPSARSKSPIRAFRRLSKRNGQVHVAERCSPGITFHLGGSQVDR